MCPFLSKTKPEPSAFVPFVCSILLTVILTTPGSDFSKISINERFLEYAGIIFSTVIGIGFSLGIISVFIVLRGVSKITAKITATIRVPIVPPTNIPDLSI